MTQKLVYNPQTDQFEYAQGDGPQKSSGFGIGELGKATDGEMPAAPPPVRGQDCHYCGMPAVKRGFFGEAVCRDCGGR